MNQSSPFQLGRRSQRPRARALLILILAAATVAGCGGPEHRLAGEWVLDVDASAERVFHSTQAQLPMALQSRPGDASYPVIRADIAVDMAKLALMFRLRIDSSGSISVKSPLQEEDSEGTWELSGDQFITKFPGGGGGTWTLQGKRLIPHFKRELVFKKRQD